MSARYTPVGWLASKLIYDAVLVAAVLLYLTLYQWVGANFVATRPIDAPTLAMKAFGSCAFLLMTLILCIGPLARLDARALPLLYNRRHFGVITAAVAAGHAMSVLAWYFAFSPTPALVALLGADAAFGQVQGFPFIPFGIAAFLILLLLAFTSHDFWLAFLTPSVWKALHMSIYLAYALAVLHVALGALQDGVHPLPALAVGGCIVLVTALHLAASRVQARRDAATAPADREAPWRIVGPASAFVEDRGIVVPLEGAESVAIFRHQGRLSAVSNLCAHQNGPLGEGRVVDGCITCPWHGFQYRLEDGCAPPPYTEKLATYRLLLRDGMVLLDPRPNPAGTHVAALELPAG